MKEAVRAAKILACYNRCTAHMKEKQKPKGYWTKLLCHIDALKFKTRFEFFKNGSAAYQVAKRKGWLEEICSHMITDRKKNGYWRDETNLAVEALKYFSRNEFAKGSPGAYTAAQKMGVLRKICSHMPRLGNTHNKLV